MLIVEDDFLLIREMKDAILDAFGNIQIFVANTKQEAQTFLETNNDFKLLIIDIGIPEAPGVRGINTTLGLQLIEEIRNENKSISIIAYTSSSETRIINRLSKANASFIFKFSTTVDSLLKEIAKFL